MKNWIFLAAFLVIGSLGYSQERKEVKLDEDKNLLEITYFYETGEVSQKGTCNLDGELHGAWISYNINGEKTASAKYKNGIKTGKWFYWNDDKLTEVDYDNNAIANVIEWSSKELIATRN